MPFPCAGICVRGLVVIGRPTLDRPVRKPEMSLADLPVGPKPPTRIRANTFYKAFELSKPIHPMNDPFIAGKGVLQEHPFDPPLGAVTR